MPRIMHKIWGDREKKIYSNSKTNINIFSYSLPLIDVNLKLFEFNIFPTHFRHSIIL